MADDVRKLLENFPTEMLLEIFRYLSPTDIKESVIFVCKKWLYAARRLNCMQIKSLSFITRPPPKNTLQNIRNSGLTVTSISLYDPIFELFSVDLWQELGKTVKSIRFNRCTDLAEPHLITILKYFAALECLNFSFRFPGLSYNFNSINNEPRALENLAKVKALNLTSNIWMDMSKVEQLVARMTALEHFGLWSLGITPFNDITKVVKRRRNSLRSLSLRHCRTNNNSLLLQKLTDLNLDLKKFTFSISWIDSDDVRRFLETQHNLKILQLGTTVAFPDEYFTYLLGLPHLKELCIDIAEYQHTYHILKRFFELPALQNLSIERDFLADESVTCIGFHKIMKIQRLKHLRLNYFNITCDICKENFYASLEKLESLSLSDSKITNNEISLIFEHITRLRSLDLVRCRQITDAGMLGKAEVTSEKRQKTSNFSLKSLRGLTYLNLSGCEGLTDATFAENYEMLDLKTLNVSNLPKLSLIGIARIAKNFKSLEKLQVYGIRDLDALFLEYIAIKLPRLTELDISNLHPTVLKQDDLRAICKCKKLKTLIALKHNLKNWEINFLFENIPTLMSVNDVTRTNSIKSLSAEEKNNEAKVEESFLRVLEQVREKNVEFIKEPISLESILI
ncbi:uncharacterized protein LOC134834031 [Culicoides brevitarsis]|uniref:uncharacterized protein LOC134834031 n=1 Tax=Culicoides brevitarsis TaxID=469753 RepID=UPI00307BA070